MKFAFRILSFLGSIYLLFFMGITAPYVYSGGNPIGLVVVGIALAFLYAPFSATVLTYGLRHALWGFSGLSIFLKRTPLAPMQEMVLKSAILYVYATGIVSLIGGVVITAGSLGGPLEEVGTHFAHSLLAIFYAVVISEFILRPALKRSELLRLEQTTGETHPNFSDMRFATIFWVIVVAGGVVALSAIVYSALRSCQ